MPRKDAESMDARLTDEELRSAAGDSVWCREAANAQLRKALRWALGQIDHGEVAAELAIKIEALGVTWP